MDEAQKNLATGVIAGSAVMVVLDLLVPFAGPVLGGFIAGYLVKGDAARRGGSGMAAGLLAAIVISIAVYQRIVNTPGMGYLAGWGTGLLLYLLVGLYFLCLGFLGAIIALVVRK
jgi:hypothetical protein